MTNFYWLGQNNADINKTQKEGGAKNYIFLKLKNRGTCMQNFRF